jgi:acyl-coenzyme A synthetase/AMP-(fatty) acid ligase
MTGQAIAAFVTLQASLEGTPEIEAQIRDHVASQIASSHAPSGCCGRMTSPRPAPERSSAGC